MENKEKNTGKAYFGAVGFVVVIYILIAIVTVGTLRFQEIASAKDYVLAKVAEPTMGQIGFTIMAITAMISTFSAINATVLGSSRVNFDIAKEEELPKYFTRQLWGKPIGLIITALLSITLVNILNLTSAGFLLIFTVVNFIGFKKYKELKSRRWLHLVGLIACGLAYITMLVEQFQDNKKGVIISIGILLFCFILEYIYKKTEHNKK